MNAHGLGIALPKNTIIITVGTSVTHTTVSPHTNSNSNKATSTDRVLEERTTGVATVMIERVKRIPRAFSSQNYLNHSSLNSNLLICKIKGFKIFRKSTKTIKSCTLKNTRKTLSKKMSETPGSKRSMTPFSIIHGGPNCVNKHKKLIGKMIMRSLTT